jgi:hypothetical protein
MTARERLEAVFAGELIDSVPFALKGWRLPSCTLERELRDNGMAILDSAPVYRQWHETVTSQVTSAIADGVERTTTVQHTPKGTLTTVRSRQLGAPLTESTSWTERYPFQSAADYDALEYLINDQRVAPNYDAYHRRVAYVGTDAAFKTGAPGAAIHDVTYHLMGVQRFCMELADNPDRLLRLCELMQARNRRINEIVAKSPATVCQFGGNYSSEVLGRQRLLDHVVPHWQEVCDLMHEEGKLVGTHLDANNRLWADVVGDSDLDWIEAFTPAPDTDMSIADARAAWPGKVLFINFPSSVHLAAPAVIRATTEAILQEAAPGDRLAIGITENVPDNRWPISFPIILDACNTAGRLPVGG